VTEATSELNKLRGPKKLGKKESRREKPHINTHSRTRERDES